MTNTDIPKREEQSNAGVPSMLEPTIPAESGALNDAYQGGLGQVVVAVPQEVRRYIESTLKQAFEFTDYKISEASPSVGVLLHRSCSARTAKKTT